MGGNGAEMGRNGSPSRFSPSLALNFPLRSAGASPKFHRVSIPLAAFRHGGGCWDERLFCLSLSLPRRSCRTLRRLACILSSFAPPCHYRDGIDAVDSSRSRACTYYGPTCLSSACCIAFLATGCWPTHLCTYIPSTHCMCLDLSYLHSH